MRIDEFAVSKLLATGFQLKNQIYVQSIAGHTVILEHVFLKAFPAKLRICLIIT